MNKKEFQGTFKTLVDGLVDEFPIPYRLQKFARKFSAAPETIQKWYDGISAPANASREVVIKYLYAEQKKREIINIVKEVIKNDIRIDVEEPGSYDTGYYVNLKLGDETISTGYFDVPSCNCNC
ncbi:hypothetical protein LCGC14_3111220 [marine sediment metagenome]|uniref:Uncharacterized protein n=1 Tax=marine sediment metagenome TaxID=412755 RepID=A0A0F8WTW0_9ZZZZ